MHLAEFLSGPNKRRDRGRLSTKNATRTSDPSAFPLRPYSHFSVSSAFSLCPGHKVSFGGPRGPPYSPTTLSTAKSC